MGRCYLHLRWYFYCYCYSFLLLLLLLFIHIVTILVSIYTLCAHLNCKIIIIIAILQSNFFSQLLNLYQSIFATSAWSITFDNPLMSFSYVIISESVRTHAKDGCRCIKISYIIYIFSTHSINVYYNAQLSSHQQQHLGKMLTRDGHAPIFADVHQCASTASNSKI